jgi:hypothetical protein
VLHPGRQFAKKLAEPPIPPDFLTQRIADYFANRKLAKLPKVLVDQIKAELADDEDAADEM